MLYKQYTYLGSAEALLKERFSPIPSSSPFAPPPTAATVAAAERPSHTGRSRQALVAWPPLSGSRPPPLLLDGCQFCHPPPPTEVRHPPRARCYIRDDTVLSSPAKAPPEPLSEVLERVAKLPPAQESPRKQQQQLGSSSFSSSDCRSSSRYGRSHGPNIYKDTKP
jgi:hypothetical protein